MPDYFDRYGRREPNGRYHTINAFADGDPELTVWEHTNRDPARMAVAMASMATVAAKMSMTGTYDFSWVVSELGRLDKNRTLIVDVGGGKGHAVEAISRATPGLPTSRCVVEDLADVVEEARRSAEDVLKEAQFVAVDFHKEQPIKGTLSDFFRRSLLLYCVWN